MAGFGWDDLLSVPTMGLYTAQKQAGGIDVGEAVDDLGEGMKDYGNVGKNKFQPTPYQVDQPQWGGDPNAATDYYNIGAAGLGASNADAGWASAMAKNGGPQAFENQALSNNEATSRGYHQDGALNLALKGALGNQPSVAAYQLQSGLDSAVAQQQAMTGGARSAGGIALAANNAGANVAALQNQAFTQAGQLRAQEIAGYSSMYGQLAGQQREQDQNRLGMGNQMSQFNASNTTQRQLGFGQLANDARRTGQGYYGQMGHGYDANQQAGMETNATNSNNYNQSLGLGASIAQSNSDNAAAMRDRYTQLIIQGGQTGGQYVASKAGGGPKPV
jgi:hypothetical protein